MPFHMNKKGHDGGDSMWTSYSDLFLGLSVVFLLLYVTASLRQGTDGIRQHMEYQKLSKENSDIKQQLKIYSTLKQNYLEKEAQVDEKNAYEELMAKLDLLQEEAKEEKIKLRKAADENDKKEKALNKYQQMIRNIMNANLIAKSRIKNRDSFIDEQETTIDEQTQEIASLEKSVEQKKNEISRNNERINTLESNLDNKLAELKQAYQDKEITKKQYEQQQRKAREDAETRIAALRGQAQKAQTELRQLNNELGQLTSELEKTKTNLVQTEQKNVELTANLASAKEQHDAAVSKLRADYNAQRAKEKADFEAAMAKEKLSAAERARREAAFRANAEKKAKELADQMAGLDQKYKDTAAQLESTSSKLAQTEADLKSANEQYNQALNKLKGDYDAQRARDKAAFDNAMAREKLSAAERARREAAFRAEAARKEKELGDKISGLNQKYNQTSKDLAKAQENLNARRKLAEQIKKNFQKNGVQADVDPRTGEVVLAFGNQHFDSGSANLKSGMKKILEQAVPVYSASLFEDQNIADKISNVEIVGFASPTYKGRYIDPKSLKPDDQQAIKYNLDLSYQRARSIFDHAFDARKMTFKHQQRLLPLVKVTGRSFFDQADSRHPASDNPEAYCKKNDCEKLQRVIIKFNLKD